MTPERRAEIIHQAKTDADALKSGWSVPGRTFYALDEAALYQREFDARRELQRRPR